MTKFCKDCKYYNVPSVCIRPTGEISVVTGSPVYKSDYTHHMRAPQGKCGPKGKLFVPTLWYSFKSYIRNKFKKLVKYES